MNNQTTLITNGTMPKSHRALQQAVCLLSLSLIAIRSFAEPLAQESTTARMPVTEITIFKDGHAFVMHNGKIPTDSSGNVVIDYLPRPVIGTFWPFSTDPNAKLVSVKAGQQKVDVERTALSLRELVEGNIGARVTVTEVPGNISDKYEATILDIPSCSGEELESRSEPYSGDKLRQKGNVVLLKTQSGVKVVNLDRIQDIRFADDFSTTVADEEFRNMLTLNMTWKGEPGKEADVGLIYLQRGIRWIPSYKVDIDGEGRASVRLQASIVNELADLKGVTAHLVIGVPSFDFKDTVDPISLQQTIAKLSTVFSTDSSQTAYGFNNAIMTQLPLQLVPRNTAPAPANAEKQLDLGPSIAESGQNEELFVFSLNDITLKKGERMVVDIGEFSMEYSDVYSLNIPYAPPAEMWRDIYNNNQNELAQLFAAPKVEHSIRLKNSSEHPLTTAPALVMKKGRILAQGLMTYAAPGASADLGITEAVDIGVKKSDSELKRTPNAIEWQGIRFARIDLSGKVTLTNYRKEPIEIEITRNVLGTVDSASGDATTEMLNVAEDLSIGVGRDPWHWWSRYRWPWWWYNVNGCGRITWNVTLDPAKPLDLEYTWHYFWN